jgi:hypothetical protein
MAAAVPPINIINATIIHIHHELSSSLFDDEVEEPVGGEVGGGNGWFKKSFKGVSCVKLSRDAPDKVIDGKFTPTNTFS